MIRFNDLFETYHLNQNKAHFWATPLIGHLSNPLAIPHENKTRGIPGK